MVAPSETLMNDLGIKNNVGWLFLAFFSHYSIFFIFGSYFLQDYMEYTHVE